MFQIKEDKCRRKASQSKTKNGEVMFRVSVATFTTIVIVDIAAI
jgi:hypothetical protein